ncbi:putative Mg2+ transporter-C (MgtC) family protein [Alkalibacillus salilacus]|uniref:Mg2+ transporter-C (MgtC) family protein n=2 Tax=Alkalibacillus salilacus TaxID=284582 RepID=A0ABT9VHJ2_9BACI|nr:MgtC/SapB family protein [Alkalibacillus salilacus]MDQ0160436.1 putative Mg2+ transporter-C (MgtC) family protein [Alkalibacillus salilacus]
MDLIQYINEQFINENFDTMLYRVLLATVLCGLIGFERELKNHQAGFRTHILVGVGACVMMLLSVYGFDPYINDHDTVRFDPARIPSYVISGIGFLGAGTILVHGMTIRGLTTAASIWTVAGLGLVIGAGMYALGILATLVVLLSLIFLNSFEKLFTRHKDKNQLHLLINQEAHIGEILDLLEEFRLQIKRMEIKSDEMDRRNVHIELEKRQEFNRHELLNQLSKLNDVTYIYNNDDMDITNK